MATTESPTIAIIGAGLSGLCLALALHQQSIPCTVYESRPEPLNIGGAVMLSPNALRILDALGVYSTIKAQGYNFDNLHFRDASNNLIETYEFGSQTKYGYPALRIYRHILITALLSALHKHQIPIKYRHKFSHIITETLTTVTFAFTSPPTTTTATLLIGADGIHSSVRKYLYPDLTPHFTGMAGITAAVPNGDEVLIGKQKRLTSDPGRDGLDALMADTDSHIAFLRENSSVFPEVVQNAVLDIPADKVNVWVFYVVPRLERWASEERRVVILGDAAHAIPPSAGQGVNQAFEDGYLLALLLGEGKGGRVDWGAALGFWQEWRQERVGKVLELNEQIDLRRLPVRDDEVSVKEEKFDLGWLYEPDFRGEVEAWVRGNVKEDASVDK